MKKATKRMDDKPTKTEQAQQMEASKTPAAKTGTPATNTVRVCWAAKTLVNEFTELFPETPVEYSNPDGRNTMLDVTFDLTAVPDIDREAAASVLNLTETDARVAWVIVADDGVLVSFTSSSRTQDSRDSFGLADAWDVLTDGEDMGGFDTGYFEVEPDYQPESNLVLDFTNEGSL